MMMFLSNVSLSYTADMDNDDDGVLSIHLHWHLTLYLDKMVDAMRDMIARLDHSNPRSAHAHFSYRDVGCDALDDKQLLAQYGNLRRPVVYAPTGDPLPVAIFREFTDVAQLVCLFRTPYIVLNLICTFTTKLFCKKF
jgi:hypothetical protein